ncbi:hypothetical protein [Actinomyces viscosus]|nr:hypothetical protein [Actinomyces viscosus]
MTRTACGSALRSTPMRVILLRSGLPHSQRHRCRSTAMNHLLTTR